VDSLDGGSGGCQRPIVVATLMNCARQNAGSAIRVGGIGDEKDGSTSAIAYLIGSVRVHLKRTKPHRVALLRQSSFSVGAAHPGRFL
jgi:hypothetical protein